MKILAISGVSNRNFASCIKELMKNPQSFKIQSNCLCLHMLLIKYIALISYFSILFLIGWLASRKIKGLTDYYVGGKKLGYWVVAFSARATGESGWLLLGVTGMGAMMGVQAFWVVVGEVIGVAIAWFLMAKPFKERSDAYRAITIPDYLVSRFQSKTNHLRIIAASTLAIFVTIYVSAQIDVTGSTFEQFLGWNYYTGALVGFAIVLLYTFSGGFVAVAWSDLFQGLVMLLSLVALPLVVYGLVDKETPLIEGLAAIDPGLLNIWGSGGLTLYNAMTIIGFLAIGLGFLGSPQVFVRFMSIKDQAEIRKGRWVAVGFTILTDAAAVCIGILGRYIFTEAGQVPTDVMGNGAEDVLPMLVDQFLPLALAGLYIAAILSAVMSTIDSLLVVASSAITRDFYQQILRPDLKHLPLTNMSRTVTVVLALIALGIAMTIALLVPGRTIFWFVIFGWSGIAATFCPMMILTLFWKNYTETGAIASMITGFLGIPVFKFMMPALPVVGPYFTQMAELAPAFALSFLAGWIRSRLSKTDKLE